MSDFSDTQNDYSDSTIPIKKSNNDVSTNSTVKKTSIGNNEKEDEIAKRKRLANEDAISVDTNSSMA